MDKSVTLYDELSSGTKSLVQEKSIVKTFRAGDLIIKEENYISSAIIIADGVAKIFSVDDKGNAHFLYFLTKGELCVLSTLCCLRMRQADMRVVAFTDCEVMFVPSPFPELWMNSIPEWNSYILKNFNKRMVELLDAFDSVVFAKLDERLLNYLHRHYMVGGARVNLSHLQIAEELNTSREVISRLLKKLEERGLVSLNRSYVTISPLLLEHLG